MSSLRSRLIRRSKIATGCSVALLTMFLLLLPLVAPVWTTFPKLTPSASAAVTSGNCYITGDSSTSLPGGGFAYSFTLNAPWAVDNFTSNPPKAPYIHVEKQSSATGKNTLTPPGGSLFNRQLRAEELSSKTANISMSIAGPDSVGFLIALSVGPYTPTYADNFTTLRTCVVKAESATSPTPPPPPTIIPTPPPPTPPGGGGGGVPSSSCPIVKSVWGDLPGAGNKYSYDFTASTSWTTTIPVKYISIQKTASKTGNNKPANPAGWTVRNRDLTVDEKRDKTALFKHQLTGPDTATFRIVKSVVPINTDGSNNTAGLSPPEINNLSQPQSRTCNIVTQKVNFPPPPAPPLDPSGGGGGTVPCSSITTQGASGSTSRTQQLNKSILTDSVWSEPDNAGASRNSTSAQQTSTNTVAAREKIIWDFFIAKGLTPPQAAGMLGNIKWESGYDPNNVNSNGGAYGIVQWLGGRKTSLFNFASSRGMQPNDMNLQLAFAWHELTGGYIDVLKDLRATNNVETATKIIFDRYEIPLDSTLPNRVTYARDILNRLGSRTGSNNGQPGSGNNQQSNSQCDSLPAGSSNQLRDQVKTLVNQGKISFQFANDRAAVNTGYAVRTDGAQITINNNIWKVMVYLAGQGFSFKIMSMLGTHSQYSSSGNVSRHWVGAAIDIQTINGASLASGSQAAENNVLKMMSAFRDLPSGQWPDEVIAQGVGSRYVAAIDNLGINDGRSAPGFGSAVGDHMDHIHVGY